MRDTERNVEAMAVQRARPRQVHGPADMAAFLSAAGTWSDVDTDALVRDIAESRRHSSKSPVEL